MKRLVIYFHYDPAGCTDTACRIAVQAVQKYGRVVFVTNGTLAPADRVWVRQSGAGRIERENVGFDVGAYREALLTLGREKRPTIRERLAQAQEQSRTKHREREKVKTKDREVAR